MRARTFRRHFADGWPAFFVANAFVEDLPDQATERMSDRADALCLSEGRDEKNAPRVSTRADGRMSRMEVVVSFLRKRLKNSVSVSFAVLR
jgi:hypothetical protein